MKKLIIILSLFISALVNAQHTNYYIATTGSDAAAGTIGAPFASVQKAVTLAEAGDSIIIRGGTYNMLDCIYTNTYRNESIVMLLRPASGIGHSGTKSHPIIYCNYPGETPIFDCSAVGHGAVGETFKQGFTIEAEYIKLRGLTVRHVKMWSSADQAMGFACVPAANLTFENCVAHDIQGRGFYYSSGAWGVLGGWPTAPYENDSTYFINCDAYNLCDSLASNPGNAADGWKGQNYRYNYISFYGCRVWNYSDDGFDVGINGTRVYNSCWMMSTDKYAKFEIEGNGIKATTPGYVTTDKLVVITNCIAAYCSGSGFLVNLYLDFVTGFPSNPIVYNNISYGNYIAFTDINGGGGPFSRTSVYRNNIAYKNTFHSPIAIYRPSIYVESNNTWRATQNIEPTNPTDPGWPGWIDNPDFTVTDEDFLSLIPSGLTGPRKSDGTLPDIRFLKLKENSDLKGAGVYVGMSTNPDIGVDWDYLKSK
jgi:hypothetical protein